MFRRVIAMATALSISISCPVMASYADCHRLVMSYIEHDQDAKEPGDVIYNGGIPHTLTETTGYCMEIYKAVETETGYTIGDFIGLYEIRDTGYGRPTGQGKSNVRDDMKSRGTIEAGLSVDRYAPTLSECKDWMNETNGMIFIRIIPAKG